MAVKLNFNEYFINLLKVLDLTRRLEKSHKWKKNKIKYTNYKFVDQLRKKNTINKSITIKKMLDKSAYVCMKHRLEKSHK